MINKFKITDNSISISASGHYVPDSKLTNESLAKTLNVSPDWIKQRTGINERRIAGKNETTTSLAIKAARNTIKNSNIQLNEIDLLIVSTSTPDTFVPSTACRVLKELSLNNIPAFDLHSSCSGFVYALSVASSYIQSGFAKNILIIAVEIRSRVVDPSDKDTASIYGDGAGAVILSQTKNRKNGIKHFILGSDGNGANLLTLPGKTNIDKMFETKKLLTSDIFTKIHQKTSLSKYAINQIIELIQQSLSLENITIEQIQCIILHQMNGRIINLIAKKLKAPRDIFFTNIEKYGNTSSASIPIALNEAVNFKQIKENDLVLLVSFGAGVTWGSTLIKW